MGLRIVLPRLAQDFRVYLDDVDLTDQLDVYSISIDVDANTGITKVKIELYADEVDVQAAIFDATLEHLPEHDSIIKKIGHKRQRIGRDAA